MKTRYISVLLLFLLPLYAFCGDYNKISLKAQRFYNQKEWASALAMYQLMLEEKPEQSDIYGKAIVAASEVRDSAEVLRLTDEALKYHIPFDSIFERVRIETFALGLTDLYEKYLIGIGDNYAWMKRAIDGYLTEYYVFRKDGRKIIEYSKIMLEGIPDSEKYLLILAQGYLLTDQTNKALETYKYLLGCAPDNFTALLYLGNYYFDIYKSESTQESYELAKKYLGKAYSVKPTPYVGARIKEL